MTPEEITEAYDVLANEVSNDMAQRAQAVGNSQRSIGGLAEVVANPSGRTSGLANYTYNRLLRPTVNALTANLVTTGKSQAMDRYLKDKLMEAKNAYEDAKNSYTVASTTPKTTSSGSNGYREQTDGEYNLDGDVTSEQQAQQKQVQQSQYEAQQEFNTVRSEGQKYYYTLNGNTVPFTVYSGLSGGLEVDGGMSYTQSGGRNFINQLRNSGARIYNSFGADVTNQLIL